MRYIDADKLLEYIGATERCGDCPYYENDIECRSHSLSRQDICNIVEDLVEEATPVQPTVSGKWIYHSEKKNIYGGKTIECSHCHTQYVVQYIEDELFCRNCGAMMVEPDDDFEENWYDWRDENGEIH